MRVCFTVLCLWGALLLPARLFGQPPSGPTLGDLAERYRECHSVRLEAFRSPTDAPGMLGRGIIITMDSRARFAINYFDEETIGPAEWETHPHYFVYSDAEWIRASRGTTALYTESRLSSQEEPPGIVHQIYCPWPRITRFVQWLQQSNDTIFKRDGHLTTATSLQARLSLTWNDQLDIVRVERRETSPGAREVVEFTGYRQQGVLRLPSAMREVLQTGVVRDGVEVASDVLYQVRAVAWNPVNLEGDLSFENLRQVTARFDRDTKNVYASDGTLLYNDEDISLGKAGLPRSSTTPVLISVAAIAVVSALVLAVRRWRTELA